ncbi:hypothetical protein [Octadecabacter sp. R77987]|uniref:hypothetical protein n=1 Tax=Octadecabacter sp. R77987 TaxID=3093874 RepID=UPI00366B18CF
MGRVNGPKIRDDLPDELEQFLEEMADQDVLRFLRALPMIGANDDEPLRMSDLIYEMRLWPYVVKAWSTADGSPGVPGRVAMISKVMRDAEEALEADSNLKRRIPRVINLTSFLAAYEDGMVFA